MNGSQNWEKRLYRLLSRQCLLIVRYWRTGFWWRRSSETLISVLCTLKKQAVKLSCSYNHSGFPFLPLLPTSATLHCTLSHLKHSLLCSAQFLLSFDACSPGLVVNSPHLPALTADKRSLLPEQTPHAHLASVDQAIHLSQGRASAWILLTCSIAFLCSIRKPNNH